MITLAEILAEFKMEAASTRKLLEVVPMDKADWAPHEKSMKLGRLAAHVADVPSWFHLTLMQDVLDFSVHKFEPFHPTTTEELLAGYDAYVKKGEDAIAAFKDENLMDPWTMRNGEQVYFTMPKVMVVRSWCLNHWYHHRGQLTVYLRLNNVRLPGLYGPTADDRDA